MLDKTKILSKIVGVVLEKDTNYVIFGRIPRIFIFLSFSLSCKVSFIDTIRIPGESLKKDLYLTSLHSKILKCFKQKLCIDRTKLLTKICSKMLVFRLYPKGTPTRLF